ncbi:MAG: hypothetical protein H7X93_01100, partial [Sphingomonadaceae bacterium]|nr:hypothetical protein [Sphingomonadaceae bacterium]
WLAAVTDLCAAGLNVAVIAPLLPALDALEVADLRRVRGLGGIVAALPRGIRTVLLDERDRARSELIAANLPEAALIFG